VAAYPHALQLSREKRMVQQGAAAGWRIIAAS